MSSLNNLGAPPRDVRSSSAISSCRDSFVPIRKKPGSSSSSRKPSTLMSNLGSMSTASLLEKTNTGPIYDTSPTNKQQLIPSPNNDNNVNISEMGFVPVTLKNSTGQSSSNRTGMGFSSHSSSSSNLNNPTIVSTESSPRSLSSHVSLPDITVPRTNKPSASERERKQSLLLKEDQEFIERLKQKVLDQQAEIEKSNGSLEQIQRNFEQLSTMYRSKFHH